jgi:hypothetical protein
MHALCWPHLQEIDLLDAVLRPHVHKDQVDGARRDTWLRAFAIDEHELNRRRKVRLARGR